MTGVSRTFLMSVTAMSGAAIMVIIFAWMGPGLDGLSRPASAEVLFNEDEVQAIYSRVSPAVVEVNVDRWDGTTYVQVGFGSGFLVDGEGHIATNYHVIEEGDRVRVDFLHGAAAEATVLGRSPSHDLALLKVPPQVVEDIEPVQLGDSSMVHPGQLALAIGSPFQLAGSLSAGVISGVDRALPNTRGRSISGVLQSDALIGPGNSGGPLLDGAGQVVGINTAIEISSTWAGRRSAGFAVPVNALIALLPKLKAGVLVRQPWLGIEITDVDLTQENNQQSSATRGVCVTSVAEDSPAARAGINSPQLDAAGTPTSEGDIIIGLDGQLIDSSEELIAMLDNYEVGHDVTLTILRNGRERHITATLDEWPDTTTIGAADQAPIIPGEEGQPVIPEGTENFPKREISLPDLIP